MRGRSRPVAAVRRPASERAKAPAGRPQRLSSAVCAARRLPWPCRPRRALRHGRSPGTNRPPDGSRPGSPSRSRGPSRHSLRSLRSLRSDRRDESDDEARGYARGHEPCDARRLPCALRPARTHLCRQRSLCSARTPQSVAARQAVPGRVPPGAPRWRCPCKAATSEQPQRAASRPRVPLNDRSRRGIRSGSTLRRMRCRRPALAGATGRGPRRPPPR